MTATKDPNMNNRLSVGASNASVTPITNSRPPRASHSHSLSVGSINNLSHRVSRRKSSSSAPTAAFVAAINMETKRGKAGGAASKSPFPHSLPANGSGFDAFSAVADGPPLATLTAAAEGKPTKGRARRASEGSRLIKGRSGDRLGGSPDLKCDKCGKGYKHSSCLYKHLWEHTPEWAYTAKLLISKHQQVQLLEAASVLLAMNEAPESSETSSPPESGSSAHSDVVSSTETSPPPQERPESKRFSSNSSVYSQSYQSSVFSNDKTGHYRQWSTDAGTSVMGDYGDEDQADLAAAVGLLSCSYGSTPTPVSIPDSVSKPKQNHLPPDVPPVPPLPAQFLGHQKAVGSSRPGYDSYMRERRDEDVEMADLDDRDDAASSTQGPSQGSGDEDEGMFGKMEE